MSLHACVFSPISYLLNSQTTHPCLSRMAQIGIFVLVSSHLMPQPSIEPTSVELHLLEGPLSTELPRLGIVGSVRDYNRQGTLKS